MTTRCSVRLVVGVRLLASLCIAAGAWGAAGCGTDTIDAPGPGAMALYDTSPAREDFFALPWPSDERVRGEGGEKQIDLTGLYNPGAQIGQYVDDVSNDDLGGFGPSATIYFRFDAALDPSSLPQTAAESVAAASPAFVVDVTPGSPTFGERSPVRARFTEMGGKYIGSNWLAMAPEPGFPLREGGTYVAAITDGLRAADRGPVRADPRFEPAAQSLGVESLIGLPVGVNVIAASRFTTGTFTARMRALREVVRALPAPQVEGLVFVGTDKSKLFDTYEGTLQTPIFQEGDPPYLRGGGRMRIGPDGEPQVVRMETVRFALSVPAKQPIPEGGWPIVLYGHGTGGDYKSFIREGSALRVALVEDEDGDTIARMAMIGIDLTLHGPRDPTMSSEEITFVNFLNLPAARDNIRQGATDFFQLLRLVEGIDVAEAPKTGAKLKFDGERLYFKGHSQGGLVGPLFLAFEPRVKAAVLSGAGANLRLAFLGKTEPNDIPKTVSAIVGEDVDEFHPLLALMQTFLEPADPGNYARYFFAEPPDQMEPKSIFHSCGLVDNYTPVPTIEALAIAMGVQPVRPTEQTIADFDLRGIAWADAPVANNVAGGKATGVLRQYRVPLRGNAQSYDGHFVVARHPDAQRQSNTFLATHAKDGVATLVP